MEDFREFRIRLINGDGGNGEMLANVIDFVEYVKGHMRNK